MVFEKVSGTKNVENPKFEKEPNLYRTAVERTCLKNNLQWKIRVFEIMTVQRFETIQLDDTILNNIFELQGITTLKRFHSFLVHRYMLFIRSKSTSYLKLKRSE